MDVPPTPPCESAEISRAAQQQEVNVLSVTKTLLKDKNYILILFLMSAGNGSINAIIVKCEQMICPYGYDSIFAGRLVFLFNMSGVFGIVMVSALLRWKNKPSLYVKLFNIIIMIQLGIFCFVPMPRGPLGTAFLVLYYVILGYAGIGLHPVFVQLLAEVSFPNPESVGLTLATISSQVSNLLMVAVENYLSMELKEDLDVQVCWKEGAAFGLQPRDYKHYKMFIFLQFPLQPFLSFYFSNWNWTKDQQMMKVKGLRDNKFQDKLLVVVA